MENTKLKSFHSVVEAELAKNLLKESGVIAYVQKNGVEFAGDMGDSYGADLFVRESDVEKARAILKDSA